MTQDVYGRDYGRQTDPGCGALFKRCFALCCNRMCEAVVEVRFTNATHRVVRNSEIVAGNLNAACGVEQKLWTVPTGGKSKAGRGVKNSMFGFTNEGISHISTDHIVAKCFNGLEEHL
jgi:hypothetical protein